MANKIVYLRGSVKWAKVQKPDPKFGNYTIDLYLDKDSWSLYKDSGLDLKLRSDDDGEFIKLRRAKEKKVAGDLVDIGPPTVVLMKADGTTEKFDDLVGNGSRIVAKVRVYDTDRGPGHELLGIMVEELVPYQGAEVLTTNGEEFPF